MDRPEPFVLPEVNLRGFSWMRLDTARLLESDMFAKASGDEFKAAVALWCRSWSQVPAASLPNDDVILRRHAGVDSSARWKKLKAMALRGWVECSDGRLYHPVVAEQAKAAWEEKLDYLEKKQGDAERKQREREERSHMFDVVKAAGHRPSWNIKTQLLRDLFEMVTHQSRVTGGDQSQAGHADIRNRSPANTGQDGTGQDYSIGSSSTSVEGIEDLNADGSPRARPVAEGDPAHALGVGVPAAKRLRAIFIAVQALDPTLLQLVTEKFTIEQMALVAAELVLRKACLWANLDGELHQDLHELLASGATQQQMALTPAQYQAIKTAATEVGINYIASTLRGRRRDAANETGAGNGNASRGAGGRDSGRGTSTVERVKAHKAAADRRDADAGQHEPDSHALAAHG